MNIEKTLNMSAGKYFSPDGKELQITVAEIILMGGYAKLGRLNEQNRREFEAKRKEMLADGNGREIEYALRR